MIERKTVLDKIEINRDGSISLRLGLLLVEGDNEIACNWHRVNLPSETDIGIFLNEVNQNLIARGEKPISEEGITRILSLVE